MQHILTQDSVAVSLDVVWQGSSGKHDARMSEISVGGCFIDSITQGRAIGELVDFKVHLPAGPWVPLQGELIIQEYPIGFGLQFRHLTDSDRKLLAQVVAEHGGRPVPDAQQEDQEVATALVSQRILVAEDDALTRRMVTAIVEPEGYTVVAAADGREAHNILQQDANFNAAIFDMAMPHIHGLDLIRYMKTDQRLRQIPVAMITAEQDPKVWDDSLAAGAAVFLPKPFTPPQVKMLLHILTRS